MITWIMGGIRAGPKPRSTFPVAINTFYNIEQIIVVDLFSTNNMHCNITPTISSYGGKLAGLGTISNSPITTNSISWKSQQSTTFTLVWGVIVIDRIPISTSPFNINYCSPIARGSVAGLLWPRSTSTNISSTIKRIRVAGHNLPTSTTSFITWVRVAGLLIPVPKTFTNFPISWLTVAGIKRHMSINFLTQRYFNKFFFRTFLVVVTAAGRIMDGLTRPRS